MTSLAIIIADAADGNAQLLLWGGVFIAVLLIGAVILARVNKWREGMTCDLNSTDSLAAFQLSYEDGELDDEEYKRIRARLIGGKPLTPKQDKKPDSPTS